MHVKNRLTVPVPPEAAEGTRFQRCRSSRSRLTLMGRRYLSAEENNYLDEHHLHVHEQIKVKLNKKSTLGNKNVW